MADAADMTDICESSIRTAESLYLHNLNVHRHDDVAKVCEHCEEHPPMRLANGLLGRNCYRCADELLPPLQHI